LSLLEAKQPLKLAALLAQGDLSDVELMPAIELLIEQGKVITIGEGENCLLMMTAGWEQLTREVTGTLQEYHQRFPVRLGMPQAELASRLKMGSRRQAILRRLFDDGVIIQDGAAVRLATYQVRLTQAQQASLDAFLRALSEHPYTPPRNLIPESDLLNLLITRNQVVKVADDVVFSVSAYDEMVDRVTSYLKAHGKVTVAEVRDMFQTSRKYALALLEHLDGKKITRRIGDERVLL